jgi:predicted flavoprotein YhiN
MIATRVPLVGQTRGQVVTTGDNPDQIFDDLLKHSEVRSVKLREYSAVRTYALTDMQGKVQAKETVRMDYVGQTTKRS